jgi:hypothetical protein
MDDILILAPTRWQLRGAVKVVNQTLGTLSLEKHPDKTFIGRIERGFDFLGYHFCPAGLAVAKQMIANFIEKASRLYEQERSTVSAAAALEMCVRRWLRWAEGGIRLAASGLASEKRKTASRRSMPHRYRGERSGCDHRAVFPLAPQPSKPIAPRPPANNGNAAGRGVVVTTQSDAGPATVCAIPEGV